MESLAAGADNAAARQALLQRGWLTAPAPATGLSLAERRLLALLASLVKPKPRAKGSGKPALGMGVA